MAIELVTGHSGEGHVSSADVGRFNAGICGDGKYVLSTGSQFEYTIVSANQVNIASGDAVNQGRHIIIPQNTSESAAIQNGTQGKTRIDVIALRYSKTTTTVQDELVTIESASLVVIKGTEVNVGSSPAVPAVTSGNIFNGAATDDMPLYHVLITNTSITSVTKVFDVLDPLSELSERITQAVNNMPDLIYPVGSIYMSVNNTNPGTLFGGTWEQIQGKFLLGQSSGHAGGSTGGAETVTLTTAQLPSHTHSVPAHTHTVPDHQHTIPAHTHTATCAEAGNHRHKINRYQSRAVMPLWCSTLTMQERTSTPSRWPARLHSAPQHPDPAPQDPLQWEHPEVPEAEVLSTSCLHSWLSTSGSGPHERGGKKCLKHGHLSPDMTLVIIQTPWCLRLTMTPRSWRRSPVRHW